ncbi:MAG: hypothetical protein KDK70_40435, partial [Myxococcales bacterium]|nr:hypothetical protein [Myxococcales bacterium]
TPVTCAAQGLVGADGYVATTWDMPAMTAIAAQLGLVAGGVNGCCVQFGWIQNNTIYTHNFGPEFFNWSGCYSDFPTLKACNPL